MSVGSVIKTVILLLGALGAAITLTAPPPPDAPARLAGSAGPAPTQDLSAPAVNASDLQEPR